jgi:hypothetical protein
MKTALVNTSNLQLLLDERLNTKGGNHNIHRLVEFTAHRDGYSAPILKENIRVALKELFELANYYDRTLEELCIELEEKHMPFESDNPESTYLRDIIEEIEDIRGS